jgi:RHS repeat-associated protein
VAEDAHLALRFSGPIAIEGVTAGTIVLTGPNGDVPVRAVLAESGRLLFLWPQAPLASDSDYVLRLPALADEQGGPVKVAPIAFTTRRDPRAKPPVAPDAEAWVPDADSLQNGWRSGRPDSPWQQLPARQATDGITALAGQVLRLDGLPLPGVTLAVGNQRTETDRTGRFLLPLPEGTTGRVEMLIDGRTASRPRRTYGLFEVGVAVRAGRTTVLPYTVWMPLLDTAHTVRIPSPTTSEVVVTTPRIPGLELHLPAGTVIRDEEGAVVRELTITPIPLDRPPFALPSIEVPVYFTIQPGGAYVHTYGSGTKGAWLVYPNGPKGWAGKRIPFYHYDPEEKDWYVYGLGTVMPNRAQVVPDASTRLYEFNGAMINMGWGPPADAEPPGDCCGNDGDPVNLTTGLFELEQTDLSMPDVLPIALTRTYRTRDLDVRPFGIGTTHPYAIFLWSALQYQEADLILPDGGRIHYVRTSAGTGFTNAVFEHKETATTSATPTGFYKSTLTWNGAGWDLRMKDGMVYVFGENAPLQAIRDRYGNTIRLTWSLTNASGSGYGNLLQVTSPHGRWIRFTYDGSNRISEATDPIGRTVGYTYDALGRLWKVTDPLNQVTEYTYDANHRMVTVKNRNGVVFVTNEYYATGSTDGWVKKQTFADGGAYQWSYSVVNGKSTQTDVTNPRGFQRRVTFNSSGYTLTDTRALGTPEQQVVSFERPTSANFIALATDAIGTTTRSERDASGNLTTVIALDGTPDAVTVAYTFDPVYNQVASITDELNHTTVYSYDAAGHLSSITDPLNHVTTMAYNSAGQRIASTDHLQNTTHFEYLKGDLIRITDPLMRSMTWFVDAVGRKISLTDPAGRRTAYSYDAVDRVTQVTDPTGSITLYSYLPDGQTQTLTDANQNTNVMSYDVMGRFAGRTDPLGRTEALEYDLNGNRVLQTDREGRQISRIYDGLNRLKRLTYADGAIVDYVYDVSDRVTAINSSAFGNTARTYDAFDRLTTESTAEGTISYTYTGAGLIESVTVSGTQAGTYAYDDANRLESITRGADVVSFQYDATDRRTALTLPNGVITEYSYDSASQLTGLVYKNAGGTTIGDLGYAYDATGNRVSVNGSFARVLFPAASVSGTYDAANRLTNWGGETLTHDKNGFLTAKGLTTYGWNVQGQLTAVDQKLFGYDAVGRRKSVTEGGTTRSFLYDRGNIVEDQVSGVPVSGRLVGPGIDEWFRGDGGAGIFPLTDGLESTVAVVDSTGALVDQYTYEPYGRTTNASSGGNQRYQFTGREKDDNTLCYYRMRYYDAGTMRFLSEDPSQWQGGMNFYTYVDGAPTRFVDPFGLQAKPSNMPIPRPDKRCCDKKQLEDRISRVTGFLNGIKRGQPPTGKPMGSTARMMDCDPATGWCVLVPRPPEDFNSGCSEPDECVNYCCNRHEWFHFTDQRRYNRNWDLVRITLFKEKPAHEIELRCLKSFR